MNEKLQKLLGDKYKEEMTVEEITAALSEVELVDPKTLPPSVAKSTFDKTASDLAKLKKELEEVKAKSMTEEERVKQQLEDADITKKQYLQALSQLRAKEVFVGAGLSEEEYTPLLDVVTTDSEETTRKKANEVVSLMQKRLEQHEQNVRKQILKETPKPPKGDGSAKTELDELQESYANATKLEERISIRRKIHELQKQKE